MNWNFQFAGVDPDNTKAARDLADLVRHSHTVTDLIAVAQSDLGKMHGFNPEPVLEAAAESTASLRLGDSLNAYILFGRPTGDFLHAVLSNSLTEAFGRADTGNREQMFEYASWLWNSCPMNARITPRSEGPWLGLCVDWATSVERHCDKLDNPDPPAEAAGASA